ncbi:MAG: tetratricopeptide repeat protein [Candidatus Stygibacter australis]|nr:tetratricopeptide repeat protein [Candidatus Stygibacter australis]MDP8321994.1 tetratricopeptide repeat protein [Candidatus Stygibacter australis]
MRGVKLIFVFVVIIVFFQLTAAAGEELAGMLMKLEEQSGSDPAMALETGEKALAIAREEKDTASESKIFRLIADSYYYLNDLKSALNWYEQAADLVKELEGDSSPAYGMRLGDVAYCQDLLMQYEQAEITYQSALKIAKKLDDKPEEITILNNLGINYYKQARYDKAMEYLQDALQAEETYGNEEDISTVLNSIGMVYEAWNEEEKAIGYYQRALAIDRKYGDLSKIAVRLNNLGYIYRDMEDYDQALAYLLEALEIEREIGNPHRIMNRISNITSLYIALEQYDLTRAYLEETAEYLQQYNNIQIKATYYENYGNYYFNRKEYGKAVEYHLQALELAEDNNLESLRFSSYSDLAAVYSEKGDFESALYYRNSFMGMQDSLFTEEKHKQIAELEMKYETEKKENEIEFLKKNAELQELQLKAHKRSRNLLFLVLILVILLVIVISISLRRKAEVRRIRQAQKAMEQSRLAILGELAAGIVHEINQPLQSISFTLENLGEALKEGYADQEYIEKKSGFMNDDIERMRRITDHIRTFSHNQSEEKQELIDLNESIHNALRMTTARFSKHQIKITVELTDNLPRLQGNLYSFEQVILILLSNARDAVEEMNQRGIKGYQKKICVRSEVREDGVVVQVADNGGGIAENIQGSVMKPFYTTKEAGKGTGLGLAIARGIINEMQGSININSAVGKGTIINLNFAKTGD